MQKTDEQIHYNMSRIRCKDTGIEVRLRKELWSRGLRYRKNISEISTLHQEHITVFYYAASLE